MKKLIDIKDWCIMCTVLCLGMTVICLVITLDSNEKHTKDIMMIKNDMREIARISQARESRFNADYPDTKYYPDIEPMESATSWKKGYKKYE